MNDKRIELLSNTPIDVAIIKMSLPVVVGMMVQVFYNLVDAFFIGKLGDPNQIAAASLATPISMILMAIAGIVGTGAASYISRCLGQQNRKQAEKTVSIGMVICLLLGIIITVLGVLFITPIVKTIGASEQTFEFTYNYVIIMLTMAAPIMINFALGQLIRAEGSAILSMTGMFIGTIINIILDPIFIFVLDMGVTGAAIATVIGNVGALCYYLFCYLKGKTILRLHPSLVSFDKKILFEIFAIGIPATLSQMLMSVAMIVCNNLAASYSDIVVAGMGISSKIMTIGIFIFIGFANGCQPLIGYNYGAKNMKRVLGIVKHGAVITSSIGIILAILFWIFAELIIGLFADNTEVIAAGVTIIRACLFSLPFVGCQMLCFTTIQAMGKALEGLFLSISRQGILYIPLLLLLNYFLGFTGFIYAQPITDMIMVVISSILLLRIVSKVKRELISS